MKRRLLLAALVLAVGVQFIPVDRGNPRVTGELSSPAEIRAILERSCYDCHSNETKWPWYSRVAPVSWLIARDVEEGREHLNFSKWGDYSVEDRIDLFDEIAGKVKGREMPLWFYVPLHPSAELSDQDIGDIVQWALRSLAAQLPTERTDGAMSQSAVLSDPPPSP